MKLLKSAILFIILVFYASSAFCGEKKISPITITKPIRLKILKQNTFEIIEQAVLNENQVDKIDYKIILKFSKGKFSQIKEEVYAGDIKQKEEDINTYSDDNQVERNIDILKDTTQSNKIVYTFISI